MPALNVLSSMHTTLFGGTIVLKLQNMPRPNAQRNPRRCSGPVPTAVGSIAKGVVALQKVGRKGSMKVSQVTAPLANQILEALSAARVRMSLSPKSVAISPAQIEFESPSSMSRNRILVRPTKTPRHEARAVSAPANF